MITPRSAASQLRTWGASVTAIGKESKRPIHKWACFYETPQSDDAVRQIPWDQAVGVGVLNGINHWRTFDIDKCPGEPTVDTLLAVLGLPSDYRWVWRSGSGKGWEVAFICRDELPVGVLTGKEQEPGVFWGLPKDGTSFDHIELRWDRCQTIYPPSQYAGDGPGYRWRGQVPEAAPAVVSVGHVLAAFFAVAILKLSEPKIARDPKPRKQEPIARPASDRDAIDEIKHRFDLLAYARKHWPGDTQQERNGEIRILGHGGFLINEEKGTWNSFRDDVGGDALELIGYHLYGDRWDHDDGTMFRAALEEGAQETGVELPPPQLRGGEVYTVDESTPEGAAIEIKRLRARVAQLEGWRQWVMDLAALPTERLSPAAKVTALSLWPEMQSREERGIDEPRPLWIEDRAKAAGLSPGTYGKRLKELANVKAIVREEARDPRTGRSKTLIAPAAWLEPATWTPPEAGRHGGERPGAGRPAPECTTCPPETPIIEHEQKTTTMICGGCSAILSQVTTATAREWHPNNQLDCWPPQVPEQAADPNPQLEALEKDCCHSQGPQVECWPLHEAADPNNQVDCWPLEPPGAPAPPSSIIRPDVYRRHAAERKASPT